MPAEASMEADRTPPEGDEEAEEPEVPEVQREEVK